MTDLKDISGDVSDERVAVAGSSKASKGRSVLLLSIHAQPLTKNTSQMVQINVLQCSHPRTLQFHGSRRMGR